MARRRRHRRDRAAAVGDVGVLRRARRPADRRAHVPAGRRLERAQRRSSSAKPSGGRASTPTRRSSARTCVLDGEPYRAWAWCRQGFRCRPRTSIWAMRPHPSTCRRELRTRLLPAGDRPDEAAARPSTGTRADLTAVAAGLARDVPADNRGRGVELEPVRDAIVGSDLRVTSMLFLGVVGFVLLICCANVANLLLARATARSASWRFAPPSAPAADGSCASCSPRASCWRRSAARWARASAPPSWRSRPSVIPAGLLPASVAAGLRSPAWSTFCAAAALLVGVLFGIAPAWQADDLTSARAIASDCRTVDRRRRPVARACWSWARWPRRCCCWSAPACCCARCSRCRTSIAAIAPTES